MLASRMVNMTSRFCGHSAGAGSMSFQATTYVELQWELKGIEAIGYPLIALDIIICYSILVYTVSKNKMFYQDCSYAMISTGRRGIVSAAATCPSRQ